MPASRMNMQSQMIQNCMPESYSRMKGFGGSHYDDLSGFAPGEMKERNRNRHHGGLVMISTQPHEFQNFLKCPPLQKINLQPT